MSFNYNHITLVGRATRKPDHIQDGETRIVKFHLAVDRPYRKEDGTVETDFIPVKMYGKLAQVAEIYIDKNKPLLIEGRLIVTEYELENNRRWSCEVLAENFQILA